MGEPKYKEYYAKNVNPLTQAFYTGLGGEANWAKQGMGEQFGQMATYSPQASYNYFASTVAPGLQGMISGPYQQWADLASQQAVKAGAQVAASRGAYNTGATAGSLQEAAMLPYLQAGLQQSQLQTQLLGSAFPALTQSFTSAGNQALQAAGLYGNLYSNILGAQAQMAAPAWSSPTIVEQKSFGQQLLGGLTGMATGGIAGGITGGIGAGLGMGFGNLMQGQSWNYNPYSQYMR